jgi:uncharacterized integral membrane protein
MMRIARFLIAYGVVSILGALVIVFLAQNTQAERLTFFGQEVALSQAWIMLAATMAGFLFALLLLLPGRIAATLHNWRLRQEARKLDEELAFQSEQRDDLLAHHEQLLRGHEWLLSAYRRSHEQLDQLIKEREVLKVQLADANDALAALREAPVRQQTIAPALPRQIDVVPAPAIPHTQVELKVPVIKAREELEETEDTHDEMEQAALVWGAHAPLGLAIEPADGTQQAHSVDTDIAHDDLARDELALARSNASSEETLPSGANWFTSRLARGWRASRSWFRRLGERGRSRVDQGIIWVRRRGSTMLGFLKSRLGATADEHRRVSPGSHPK